MSFKKRKKNLDCFCSCKLFGQKLNRLDPTKVLRPLQVGGGTPPRLEEKYFEFLFISEGKIESTIDWQIGSVSAVRHSLYRSVMVKKELSPKPKLFICRSIYVRTPSYEKEPDEEAQASVSKVV